MAKYIISVCKNSFTGKLEVVEDAYIKSLNSEVYEVDEDYDFGSIDPKDLAIQMYTGHDINHPGIWKKES